MNMVPIDYGDWEDDDDYNKRGCLSLIYPILYLAIMFLLIWIFMWFVG